MSDYHILTQDKTLKTINLVFHFETPAGINGAGISWSSVLVLAAGGADNITSCLPNISEIELTALKNGTLIEKQMNIRFSSTTMTNAQRLNEIIGVYAIEKNRFIAEKQIMLYFFGYEGSI